MIEKTDRIPRNTNLSIEKVNLIKLTFLFYPDQNFPFERGDRGPPFFYLAFKGDYQRGVIFHRANMKTLELPHFLESRAISQNRYALIPLIGTHTSGNPPAGAARKPTAPSQGKCWLRWSSSSSSSSSREHSLTDPESFPLDPI